MADYPVNGEYVAHGLNEGNRNVIKHTLAQALADTDTLTVTLPTEIPPDSLPMSVQAYTPATPAVRQTTLAITSHNKTTGVTVLTASGAVADGSEVLVDYAAAG